MFCRVNCAKVGAGLHSLISRNLQDLKYTSVRLATQSFVRHPRLIAIHVREKTPGHVPSKKATEQRGTSNRRKASLPAGS